MFLPFRKSNFYSIFGIKITKYIFFKFYISIIKDIKLLYLLKWNIFFLFYLKYKRISIKFQTKILFWNQIL